MASPDVIDFERLLAPISEESPSGVELKDDPDHSTAYYNLKDLREAARSAERLLQQAQWAEDSEALSTLDRPDWRKVRDQAEDVLFNRSKDLWAAAWMIEALCRLEGFAGLRDGFRLARELCQQYWDNIHPAPDEDGNATTVAQIFGLCDGALTQPIDDIVIVAHSSEGDLTSLDYKRSVELDQVTDAEARARQMEQGVLPRSKFEAAVRTVRPEYFRSLMEDMEQAQAEFAALMEVLDEKCGRDADGYSIAPPASPIRTALEECMARLRTIAGPMLEDETAAGADGEGEGGLVAQAGGPAAAPGRVATREDAFVALQKIADFFEHTEPHSPVSYSLRQVVRWGKMSLPQLLAELISDSSVREDLFRRTGIPNPDQSSEY